MTTKIPFEYSAVFSLALLFVVRMLGLFMLLPVLALYGDDYANNTPLLLGLALGVYGFSQALLQIPFGLLSDRFGRKPLIAIGLTIFALGSIIAANADSIYGLIVGRALQGAGAISGVVVAMVADLIHEQNRTKAMAVIGLSIGITFSLALILGPLIAAHGGIQLILWFTFGLAIIALFVLFGLVPNAPQPLRTQTQPIRILLIDIFSNIELQRINLGVFVLHFVLMALFLVLPVIFEQSLLIKREDHSWLYLSILTASFVAILPMIMLTEKYQKVKVAIISSIVLLTLAMLVLSQPDSTNRLVIIGVVWLFCIGFNYLEATMPSLMSKTAPADKKGTASSAYATCQFAGAGFGGFVSGWLLTHWGITGVFVGAISLLAVWLVTAFSMKCAPKKSAVSLSH